MDGDDAVARARGRTSGSPALGGVAGRFEVVAEGRKVRGPKHPLRTAGLRNVSEEHARSIVPMALRQREAAGIEQELAQVVNGACNLSAEGVSVIRKTAPRRMPAGPLPAARFAWLKERA